MKNTRAADGGAWFWVEVVNDTNYSSKFWFVFSLFDVTDTTLPDGYSCFGYQLEKQGVSKV